MTMSSVPPIRVLIADDHALFRDGVRAILDATSDCAVVGEAADGEEAVALAFQLQPDVVLMDVHMPRCNGVEATRRVLRARPQTGVVALTMLEDDASVTAAMRAGARGYILKGADKAELLKTVRAVAAGEALFGPAIAGRIGALFTHATTATTAFPQLTEREREVLALIAQGLSNADIAQRLVISTKTLGNHITNIFGKLQVGDRAQAIVMAREAGLGK